MSKDAWQMKGRRKKLIEKCSEGLFTAKDISNEDEIQNFIVCNGENFFTWVEV